MNSLVQSLILLPPGRARTDEEWEFDCPFPACPNPSLHFSWNISKEVGRCWVCDRVLRGNEQFRKAYEGRLSEHDICLRKSPKVPDLHDPHDLCAAWDHPKSQSWCVRKGVGEIDSRIVDLRFDPVRDELVLLRAEPISKELPVCELRRPLGHSKSKWLHEKGCQAVYYGLGVWAQQGKMNRVLFMEGLSDALATGLYPWTVVTLGSDIPDIWGFWMKRNVREALFWFDADGAGEKAADKAEKLCSYYGIPYKVIRTSRDPKEFSPKLPNDRKFLDQIRGYLCA